MKRIIVSSKNLIKISSVENDLIFQSLAFAFG